MVKMSKNNISIVLLLYWITLVIWQNVSSTQARTNIDIVIKGLLLIILTVAFFIRSDGKIANLFPLVLFVLSQSVSFLRENSIGSSVVISYVFTNLFSFLYFGLGKKLYTTKETFEFVLKGIIVVALYSAFYALIFKTNQFTHAFQITNAYGNELSSFFTSSHEYAMYIAAALISCTILIELNKSKTNDSKLFYYLSMIIFIPNLVLTFSRTVIFGTICFYIVYLFTGKKSKIKIALIIGFIALALLYIFNPILNSFIDNIVFKGNTSGGRNILYSLARTKFKEASIANKVFGYGISSSRAYFEERTAHGSVHNAYLQVLLYFGIVGLAWLVVVIITHVKHSVRVFKVDKYWGVVSLGLIIWAVVMMYTNTFIIFTSPIDSFFLTMFAFIIPYYVSNAKLVGVYEEEDKL